MSEKILPFDEGTIQSIINCHPTPFHLYDESGIRNTARKLQDAFSWAPGFKEFFAVKATPNPYILSILKEEGFGADCSSLPELLLSEKTGVVGRDIMFSSNNTPVDEYKKAYELGSVINLDDISHISFIEKHLGVMPSEMSLRYNPGSLKQGNAIIGKPEESKFGMTCDQIIEGIKILNSKGVKRLGIHIMVASNELDPDYFADTARLMFNLAVDIKKQLGVTLDFINMGGGIGVAYRPSDKAVDVKLVGDKVRKEYKAIIEQAGLHPIRFFLEMGRSITGPHGFLVTKVLHLKESYKKYVGVDANMSNLMRPGMYGAYHHITVLGKGGSNRANQKYDVVGSLCENNDKFAIDRLLPMLDIDDILIFHDTGAHGHSMGFNYNGKLRSAELLLKTDGTVQTIRRAETVDDYFRTVNFEL